MFLETRKVRPERIMEMGTLEGVLGFVEANVGVTAMPESFITPISKGRKVVMLSLPKEVATARTYVVLPQQTASERLCRSLLQRNASSIEKGVGYVAGGACRTGREAAEDHDQVSTLS